MQLQRPEKRITMTDPISSFRRIAQMDTPSRPAAAKVSERATDSSSETAVKPAPMRTDEVQLSEVAQKAMQEPQFDRAKVGAEVSAGFSDTFQHKRAQLVCQGAQLRWRQTSQICGGINIFQQRTHLTAFLANRALPLM